MYVCRGNSLLKERLKVIKDLAAAKKKPPAVQPAVQKFNKFSLVTSGACSSVGKDDFVNDVNDAIAGHHVYRCYGRAINHHYTTLGHDVH